MAIDTMGMSSEERVGEIISRIQALYLEDNVPWVVGYSGGKDSTATLQLVWSAIADLPERQRMRKVIHVISTDTLVEQPIVAAWVKHSLEMMSTAAAEQNVPIKPHRLTPEPENSYWVNLIGNGYPAPRRQFRWCTERLKIQPSNQFILKQIENHGETILVLGTRKAESATRARNMEKYEKKRIREWLSPNGSLLNSFVFSPIEDWSNDDVWEYLVTYENPWGRSNRDLLDMYRGANPDNECPLVVDTSTPSCGGSRFGCWVCTVVAADKSMEAMIQNDEQKSWLTPMLELRNDLGRVDDNGKIVDRERRDFRRYDGTIKINFRDDQPIHGPYVKPVREYWLRRLLEVQVKVQENAPADMAGLELITRPELEKIREIWLHEKHEFDDALPRIYEEVLGQPFAPKIPRRALGREEWKLIEKITGGDPISLELQASLLDLTESARGNLQPTHKLLDDYVDIIKRCYYENEDDAAQFAREQASLMRVENSDPEVVVQESWFEGLTS